MSTENFEKPVIKLTKKAKAIIALLVALAVIVTGIIVVKVNDEAIYNELVYIVMPKTIRAEEMQDDPDFHIDFDIHVRKNKDYDIKTQSQQPLEAYEYYYIDPETNEEVVVKGTEEIEVDGNKIGPYLLFLIKAKENEDKIKSVATKSAWVLGPIAGVALIIVWFLIWSKKEDEQKARMANKNNNKKRKK